MSSATKSMAPEHFKAMFSRLIILAPAFIVFVITLVFSIGIGLAAQRNPSMLWGLSIASIAVVGVLTSVLGLGLTSFLVADMREGKALSLSSSWGKVKPLFGPLLLIGIVLFITALTLLIPVSIVNSIIQGILWTFITPSAVLICLKGETPVQALSNGFSRIIELADRDSLTFVLILVFYMFSWVTFGVLYVLVIPLTVLAIESLLRAEAEAQLH